MRRIFLIAATGLVTLAISQSADARQISISQKVSLRQLQNICASVGGSFWSDNNGYSCIKENCDGKGHTCAVLCDENGNCTGMVPKQIPTQSKTLRSILNPAITDIN